MTFTDLLPRRACIERIVPESADTRTFHLKLDRPDPALDAARPGQFVMLSLLGHGEAAFTPSALPGAGGIPGVVVVTVRQVGTLTGALFALRAGATVGVRGPYGHGFPDEPDVPTVYVAGGCGLSPLKPAIVHQLAARRSGIAVAVLCGARTPGTRIHRAHIHVAIERYMKCATGHCGHCYVNQRYVCRDGPVFTYAELQTLPDAFGGIAAQIAAAC
jgi:NAD(P)H-flavin reductase